MSQPKYPFLKVKIRCIFHFHEELYQTVYPPFCSINFCHFSGTSINPSSPNCFIFLSKELFQGPFPVFQGIEIFSIKRFVKIEINGNPKMQYLVIIMDELELPNQAGKVFAWWSKKHTVLYYSDERLYIFCSLIQDTFHWVLLPVGLIGSSTCWN